MHYVTNTITVRKLTIISSELNYNKVRYISKTHTWNIMTYKILLGRRKRKKTYKEVEQFHLFLNIKNIIIMNDYGRLVNGLK